MQENKEVENNEELENNVQVEDNENEEVVVEDEVVVDETEQLKANVAELNDKLLRQMAEFENFRKRTMKEKQSSYSDGSRGVIDKLLPVLDNFERALIAEENKESSLYKGIEMIYKQFVGVLDELGVKAIPTVGEEFDPNVHFAVANEESEEFGENTVSAELQKGYIMGDKVIRPAMVKVANC